MATKTRLRKLRLGTVINKISSAQEKELIVALRGVEKNLSYKWPDLRFDHAKSWKLSDVVSRLRTQFPQVDFHHFFERSSMNPDGGIFSILDKEGTTYPILIMEKKNQGTNDARALEGKKKQSQGNAIERLGKNVIGFRTAFKQEAIFPFVCFGDGCDFSDKSSILDRVVTIAMFGKLNFDHTHKQGGQGEFDRGSFYFRPAAWTAAEMETIATQIAIKSVYYYFSKYGEDRFFSS